MLDFKRVSPWLNVFFIVYSLVLLGTSYSINPMHDYALYFRHWDLVLNGQDPWQKMEAANAYGPVYNLFAWLYKIDYQLPKLIFTSSWLLISIYTVRQFWQSAKPTIFQKWLYLVFWFFSPFFILSTAFYGFNDSFVALLVFLGVIAIAQYRNKALGVALIALGTLTKLYPLFLIPFVSTRLKKFSKYITLFLVIVVGSYLLTFIVWGDSFLNAFGKANGRDPTLFSVMRFVTGAYFPVENLGKLILALSNLLILLGLFYVFKRFKQKNLDQITAFLAAFTVLLMFYKAGQQQFYMVYFAIFAAWTIIEFKKETPNIKAFYSVLLLGLWFAVMAGLVYPLTGQMEGEFRWIRDLIGLPNFTILLMIAYHLLKSSRVDNVV